MRAGNKNRRVRIETLSINKSTFGTDTETWSLLREVWAEQTFMPLKEIEVHAGQEIESQMFVQWKIDYIAGISPKGNRVVYQGQIYDIWHVAEVGFREALLLKTQVRAVAGAGSGVGISGSAQQSSPPTQAQLTRMGTFSAGSQADGTVTVIAYSEYQFTIQGLNNLVTDSGTGTITVKINGIAVTGITNINFSSVAQNPQATGANIVNVGDRVDFVFTNSAAIINLKFTMKGAIR